MTDPIAYRYTLRDQLEVTGPAAIDMLRGQREPDAAVLLGALEAASLLDEVTVGAPLRALRQQVRDACEGSKALPWLTSEALSLSAIELPDDPMALEDTLHQVVTLAALPELLPEGAARRVRATVDDAIGRVLVDSTRCAALAPLAEGLLDRLDLTPEHPVQQMLSQIAMAAQAPPLPEGAVEAGYARARAALELAAAPQATSIPELAKVLEWIRDRLSQPVTALASADDPVRPPHERIPFYPHIDPLDGGPLVDLNFVWVDGTILAEIHPSDGEYSLHMHNQPLAEAPKVLPDAQYWRLPADMPATGFAMQVYHRGGLVAWPYVP